MSTIILRALGRAELVVGDCCITPSAPKKFGVLLALCAEAGRQTPRAFI